MTNEQQRPRPKELVLVRDGSFRIFGYAHSEDAIAWLETEMPKFGRTFEPTEYSPSWICYVIPTYDFDEVLTWLGSYNSQ